MRSGVAPLCAAVAAITAVTALQRGARIPLASVAPTPESFYAGRVWLLATSAFVADRPTIASIAGLAVVGLAVLRTCGSRVLWVSAAVGHVGSAAAVYGAIALARAEDPGVLAGAQTIYDYGTSAVIAAWIGVLSFYLWQRDRRLAVALCVASGAAGWLFHPNVTVLDTEHVVALAAGVAIAGFAAVWAIGPRLGPAPRH